MYTINQFINVIHTTMEAQIKKVTNLKIEQKKKQFLNLL